MKILLMFIGMCMLTGTSCFAEESERQLRFSWWGSQDRKQATECAVQTYMTVRPDVTIQTESESFSRYYQKLIMQLNGNDLPDILAIDYKWAGDLKSISECFVDLSAYTKQLGMTSEQEAFSRRYGGGEDLLLGVPMGLNAHVYFYNECFFEQFGLASTDIDTWKGLLEAGEKVHQMDASCYLLYNTMDEWGYLVQAMLKQMTGESMLRDDGSMSFTREQLTDVFVYIRKLVDTGTVPPFELGTLYECMFPKGGRAWAEGKIGILPKWSTSFPAEEDGVHVCYRPYPVIEGARNSGAMIRPTLMLAVSSQCGDIDEAVALIDYLINDPQAAACLGESYGVPMEILTGEDMTFSPIMQGMAQIVMEIMTLDGAKENEQSLQMEVQDIIRECVYLVGYNIMSADEVAGKMMKELDELRRDD